MSTFSARLGLRLFWPACFVLTGVVGCADLFGFDVPRRRADASVPGDDSMAVGDVGDDHEVRADSHDADGGAGDTESSGVADTRERDQGGQETDGRAPDDGGPDGRAPDGRAPDGTSDNAVADVGDVTEASDVVGVDDVADVPDAQSLGFRCVLPEGILIHEGQQDMFPLAAHLEVRRFDAFDGQVTAEIVSSPKWLSVLLSQVTTNSAELSLRLADKSVVGGTQGQLQVMCRAVVGGKSVSRLASTAVLVVGNEGTVDSTFGRGGEVVTPVPDCVERLIPHGIVADAKGRLVVTGEAEPNVACSRPGRYFIARFTAAGALDASIGIRTGRFEGSPEFLDSALWAPLVTSDGRLAVAASATTGADSGCVGLARFTADLEYESVLWGKCRSEFSDSCVMTGRSTHATSAVLLPDGKIVVDGQVPGCQEANASATSIYDSEGNKADFPCSSLSFGRVGYGTGHVVAMPDSSDVLVAKVQAGPMLVDFMMCNESGVAKNLVDLFPIDLLHSSVSLDNDPAIVVTHDRIYLGGRTLCNGSGPCSSSGGGIFALKRDWSVDEERFPFMDVGFVPWRMAIAGSRLAVTGYDDDDAMVTIVDTENKTSSTDIRLPNRRAVQVVLPKSPQYGQHRAIVLTQTSDSFALGAYWL